MKKIKGITYKNSRKGKETQTQESEVKQKS